jgi:hypothetical protein
MPSTKQKALALLDAYQEALTEVAAGDGPVHPWVALVALALPLARAEGEKRDEQFYGDIADQMAAASCAFRDDERGGFVYLPGELFGDDAGAPLIASVDAWNHSGEQYIVCHLGPRVELPPELARFNPAPVRELVRDLAAFSEQDLGGWLQRLGQEHVRLVAPPALPGPEGDGGPGQ